MAYPVSQEFTQKLYSGECNYRANLTIGEQTIDNDQIASISISSPIVDSSTQTFYIGTFISQKITIHFKNMDNLNIYSGEQVDLSIGQYVNNAWVDVPIGKFLIDDLAEDYYEKCEITCLDYAVKFKPNIDYSPCFVDGKATIKTILEYICNEFDVELGDYPSINDNIEVGTYDSTVSGKQWISYIAELKGCNAKMDRQGRLTLQPLKQASNVSINALESASFDLGEKYNITKVTFFDALRNFTYGDDEGNTLFIRQDNPFVTSEEDIRNVYNSICTEKLSAEGKYIDIEDADANDIDLVEISGNTYQKKVNGYQLLKNTNVDSGDGNYWVNYSTFDPVSRILTRSTTSTTESFITHNIVNILQPNTTYTLSCMIKQNGKVNSIEFYMYSRAGGSSGIRSIRYTDVGTSWVKKTWTFTTYSNIDYTNSSIRFDNNGSTDGTTAILYVRDVMLEQGSTAHDYEDYPLEPNYPYAIKNVCGSNKITINNKNIYDPSYRLANGTVHCSHGTATEENGVFTLTATGADLYNWGVRNNGEYYVENAGKLYEFTDNATYICKCTNDLFKNTYVTYYDENEVSLGYVAMRNTAFKFSQVDKPNAKYFSLRFGYATAVTGETYSYSVELEKAINLFDRNNANGLVAYINDSGVIKTDTQLATIYIPCQPNTTYTIRKSVQSITANNRFKVGCCASTPTIETQLSKYTNLPSGTTDTTMIFETDSTANYLVFNFAGGTATECQEILNSVQIEYQEQEIQEYVTHQEVSYNIDFPVENLFDKDNTTIYSGYFNASGVISAKNIDGNSDKWFYIPCNPNTTYTITKPITPTQSNNRFRVGTTTNVPEANNTLNDYWKMNDGANTTVYTLKTSANANYLCIYYGKGDSNTDHIQSVLNGIQIEKGSKANTYTPYGTTPIELNKIETYQDYIYKEDDKWYLHKEIGKLVLDGSESYTTSSAGGFRRYTTSISDALLVSGRNEIISNYFIFSSSVNNVGVGFITNGSVYLYPTTDIGTIDDFKTWLGTHNTEIKYILANPTYHKITYQPLIDQLNAIDEEAGLFEGTNHIIIEPNEETPTLNINYYKNSNFELYSLKTHNYGDFTLDAWDNINYQLGDKNYLTLNNNDIKYEMSIMGDVNTKIPTKQQEVTTNIIGGDDKTNIKKIKTNVDVLNAEATILSQQQTTTANNLSELTVNVNGISSSVQTIQNSTIPSINGDIDAINDNIDGINTTINNQNTTINNITSRLSSVEQTADAITNMFQISGGINIIRNSAFLLRDALWEFTNSGTNPYYTPLGTSYNGTLSGITTSVAEIKLRSIKVKSKSENITNLKIGTKYTFNFYHKQDANVTTTIKMYSTEDNTSKAFNDIVITGQQSLKNYEVSFTPSTYANYTLEIIVANTDNLGYSYMYDMMLNTGDKQSWQPASDEIYSTTLTMSRLGLQVYSVGDGTITLLGTEGLLTYETTDGKTLGNLVSKRTLDGDLVRSTTTQALYVTPNIASVIEDPTTPKWVNTTSTISSKLTYIEYLESGD